MNHDPIGGKCHRGDHYVSGPTGSGQGLGLAYARELVRQGAAVVINDVDATAAEEAVTLIGSDGGRTVSVVAPVGSTEVAKQLVQTAVTEFGRLDILVTNAGILRPSTPSVAS